MDRFFVGTRMGAVAISAALLSACAPAHYNSGAAQAAAITTVNGSVTTSTTSAAYTQQHRQASQEKSAVCLQIDASTGQALYHSTMVPSRSYLPLAEHQEGSWRCVDYGDGMKQTWAFLNGDSAATAQLAESSQPLGKGMLGIQIQKTEASQFLQVAGLVPLGAAEQSGQLQAGDLIIAIGQDSGDEMISTADKSLVELAAMMRGEPGTQVRLSVLSGGAAETRQVVLERREVTQEQQVAIQHQQIDQLAIAGNSGSFLSPYTSDGVTAEWVDKSINVSMGKATGSAIGGAAGVYAANKVLENVPFGGLLGGMLGSKAGKAVGGNTALEASGGWDFIRASSDISFNSLNDMARWLAAKHSDKSNFVDVISAADKIYPGLRNAVANSAH